MRIRPAIQRMKGYSPPKEGRTGLRLDFNENTAGCSPRVLEALRRASAEDLARYPEYDQGEREIAAAFGHTPESMTLTNGIDDAIQVVVQTFVDPGDEVIPLEPTFFMYRFYCQQAGAEIRPVHYQNRQISERVSEFVFDAADVLRAVTARTRVVFLASPNNPTGSFIDAQRLEDLARELVRCAPECTLFIDEAYVDFAEPGYRGLLPRVGAHRNVILARTFSKAYGLAGARLGCLFAHPEIMPVLRKVHSPYNVNTLAVICARAAVQDQAWVEDYCRQVLASRALIEAALAELQIPYWKSHANFVLFHAGDAADALLAAFREQHILIRDRRGDFPGALRITCGTVEQTERALDSLRKLWPAVLGAKSATLLIAGSRAAHAQPARRAWIAFDMDGVLVDVRDSYRAAIVETVRRLGGGNISSAQVQELKNEGGYNNDWDLTHELLRRRGVHVHYSEVVRVFNSIYRGDHWDGLICNERWLLPIPVLDQLRERYHLAIFTGRPREDAEHVLRRFGVSDRFERLLTLEDVRRGKPAPEGLITLCSLCAPAPLAAYIGDTVDDARCALAAGVPFIGITGSTGGEELLRAAFATLNCRVVVSDSSEAAALLLAPSASGAELADKLSPVGGAAGR